MQEPWSFQMAVASQDRPTLHLDIPGWGLSLISGQNPHRRWLLLVARACLGFYRCKCTYLPTQNTTEP
jgi:hypothetical protein